MVALWPVAYEMWRHPESPPAEPWISIEAAGIELADGSRPNPYDRHMKPRVVVLGAGFGGLELSTMLSEALGDEIDVTLIDKNDAFVFGYAKLDVMFGRTTPEAVRLAYSDIAKPGMRFLQQTITAIDPEGRRVTTDAGEHDADVLVVALGADYDLDATPGLAGDNEFYSWSAPSGCAKRSPRSCRVARSSASAERRSSALRPRARPRCCCTTTCRRAASATNARSRS